MMQIPARARIKDIRKESGDLVTLRLHLEDDALRHEYRFRPGQFNMVHVHGVGEIPISIVSDPEHEYIEHTVRNVGRVSSAIFRLQVGDSVGLRGPFGSGWPMQEAEGHDVLVVTGGIGCAPTVSVIQYIMSRRQHYGNMNIVQGVRHSQDLIWRNRYEEWSQSPHTYVCLAADCADALWPWHVGRVTDFFDRLKFQAETCVVMMCGPEGMMKAAIHVLLEKGILESNVYLSLERNMKCALGKCGHCQYGPYFLCKQGPVFPLSRVRHLMDMKGI